MPKPDATNALTLRGLFLILQRRRSVLIISAATCFFLAVLVCIFMTRKYQAQGAIQVAKTSFGGLGLDSMVSPSDSATDALTENIDLQTQASILQSDSLALQVIENLNLENTKDFKPKWNPIGWLLGLISPKGQPDPPDAPLDKAPLRRTRVLKVFSKNLKVEPVAGSRIIEVSYLSSNPETAAAAINELTRALVDYGFQSRSAAMSQGSEWLSSQLSDVKKQAETLQQKVVELQRSAGVYSLGVTDQTGKEQSYSNTLDHLQQGTQALTAAESTRILKGGIYEMVKSGDPELISGLAGTSLSGASPGVMNSFNLIQTLRGQEAALESQLANDSSKFGAAYPRLADERASLASIKQQIKEEVARIGERAANDYRAAQGAENELRQSYDRDRAEASKLNDKAMEYTITRQEATQAEQLYQTLFQRMKEAGVVQGLPSTNVTVVDPARIPGKPVKPNVPVYLAGSIFVGLFLGGVAVFFLDTITDKVQILKPVAQELQLPCLGALPSLAGEGGGLSLPFFGQKLLTRSDEPANPGRLAIADGSSTAFAEALRSIRTTIQLARNGGSSTKVILVTSSVPREGKSTVSSNLAAAFAQSGEEVLLIEGDLRQPSFAARLATSTHSDIGLSSLLQRDIPWKDSHADKIADVPGLRVLYAGPTPQHPAELLASQRMANVLEQVKSKFDRIVIDSPPLLPVTDAAILSHFSDVTLLIVRDELTTLKALRRASEILVENNARDIGLILNGVTRNSLNYEDYCSYASDSYYRESAKASGD